MTFANQRVAMLEAAYLANQGAVGVIRVNIDGNDTEFSSLEALYAEYLRWKTRAARENRTRPRVAQIYLGGFR